MVLLSVLDTFLERCVTQAGGRVVGLERFLADKGGFRHLAGSGEGEIWKGFFFFFE